MNYSLGNMLGGSNGSLNPDKLSLNLQFATDKTLTARKGPTPTFTRASTATFVGSDGLIQSAAINEARFDHDPVTLACRGLLIEESRTNLLLQNQTFQTTWTAANLNTTGTPAYLNVATAPDGTTTADKLIATIAVSTHQFRQSVTLVSGTTYSLTCYFKAAEQQFASIAVFGVANGNADWVSLFNVSSSPSTGTFNGFTSTSVTNAGNDWIRCTAIFTATASGSLEIRLGGASAASGINPHIYLGDGTSGILIWGAQIEAGAFPTSYIPTTTASVVRSADVCSITGSAFTGFYNQSEGTLFAQSTKTSTNANSFICAASPNNSTNLLGVRYANSLTQLQPMLDTASVNQINISGVNITSGSSPKQAFAYKLNDLAYSVNGAAVLTDASALIPSTNSQINFGTSFGGGSVLNGHIASIRYFKKRLANAKLQTLTV